MERIDEIFSKSSIWRFIILILVLLGTNPYSFYRLAKAADEYAAISKEEVFIQLGYTKFSPLNTKFKDFLSKQEIMNKIKQAEIIVTQGGFGSIADCLRVGKKVVAVPRKPEFKESPDRQEELVRELEKLGRLVGVYNIDELPEAVKMAKKQAFKQGETHLISNLINKFIAVT